MTEHSFRLHESTRRSLCRLAFVFLGLLPLALCVSLAVMTLWPGYSEWQAAAWEERLSQRLGLTIRVEKAMSLAPLYYRLENVELLHPETHVQLGLIEAINLQQVKGVWRLRVSNARLNIQQLPECCRAVHDWYVCRPLSDRQQAIVELDQLTVQYADQTAVLEAIVAELLPEPGRWGFKASFLVGNNSGKGVERATNQLIVVRYHDPDKSATEMQLRAKASLPMWLVAPIVQIQPADPQVSAWQPMLVSGRFSGVLDVRYHTSETNFYLTDAVLKNLDFGQVAGHQVPALSGFGSLVLTQAKWDSNGLQWAKGSMDLGPGRMDANLFYALAHYLQCQVPRQNLTQSLAFDRIAAGFRIQAGSIQLVGSATDGTLISDAYGALARRIDPSALPISNLIYALAATESGLPLVRKSLVWLPLDDHQRRETAQVLRIKRY